MRKIYLSAVMLFVSFTGFAQWTQVNIGTGNLATGIRLLGASNSHVFAVSMASGVVFKTNDDGNNWTQVTTPVGFTSAPKNGYYFSGKYFVGLNNSTNCIYYTTDNGTSWTSGIGSPEGEVKGFVDLSGNLFAYTKANGIFKSTDGGVNWSAANTGLTNLKIASATAINSKIVLITEGAGVFISSDNGNNWTQSNTGISGSLSGTFVWKMGTDLNLYFMTGNRYYSSNNQGASWTTAVRPSFLQSSIIGQTKSIKEVYRYGNHLYMMSTTQYGTSITDSVFITKNEGVNWTNITENLPNDILGGGLTEFRGNVFIAYYSANFGVFRRATTTVGINENDISDLISIYPNPFNENLAFLNKANKEIKQIFVYDNQGKLVLSDSGTFNFINTSGLHNGIYIIKIVFSDNSNIHRKLIK